MKQPTPECEPAHHFLPSFPLRAGKTKGSQKTIRKVCVDQLPPPKLCSEFAPWASGVPGTPKSMALWICKGHPTCSVPQ